MRRNFLLIFMFILVIVTCLSSCEPNTKNELNKLLTERSINSTVQRDKPSKWSAVTIEKTDNYEPSTFFFLDDTLGFASNYNRFISSFYITNDKGLAWTPLTMLHDVSVDGIHFVSQTEGFAISSRLKPSSNPSENGSDILRTQDGGANWSSTYLAKSTTLKKLVFNSNGIGLAIGRKSFPSNYDASLAIIISTNWGETWNDFSENINQVIVNENGQKSDYLTDAIFSKKGCMTVISSVGKLFESCDSGRSWILSSVVSDYKSGFWRLGLSANENYWVVGGSNTIHGIWGTIGIETTFGWELTQLNDYFLTDVIFLSESEILACGLSASSVQKDLDRGVILSSFDRGQTWQIILESQNKDIFTKIHAISEDRFLVFSKNGERVIINK